MNAVSTIIGKNAEAAKQCEDCRNYQGVAASALKLVHEYRLEGTAVTVRVCGKCCGDRVERGQKLARADEKSRVEGGASLEA